MKRALRVLLATALAFSVGLGGCRPSPKPTAPPKPTSPFSTDYALSETNADFYFDNDTINTLALSSPFYSGQQSLPFPGAAAFEKARAEKIQAVLRDAASIVDVSSELEPSLVEMRTAYADYAAVAVEREEELDEPARETLGQIAESATNALVVQAEYDAISDDEGISAEPKMRSLQQWMSVDRAMELGALRLREVNDLAAYSAVMLQVAENHPDAELRAASSALDENMRVLDSAAEPMERVAESMACVREGIRQLESADYYFAREADAWLASELPKVKAAADGLTPKEGLTEDDIAFIQAYAAGFEEWAASIHEHLESLDTTGLVEVTAAEAFAFAAGGSKHANPPWALEGVAWAAGSNGAEGAEYAKAMTVLNKQPEAPKGMMRTGWEYTKKAFGAAKTAAGVTVDAAGAMVRNVSQVGCGIYYGNSPGEIWEDIKDHTRQVAKNYRDGTSGSVTLRTGGEYMEGAENAAGQAGGSLAQAGLERVFGKGRISGAGGWAVGGVSKLTAGLFTGFAKGVYKVADTQSNARDVAGGMVDIGLSFIGGSKVIVKGSQVPGLMRGAADGIKNAAALGTGFVKSVAAAAEKGHLSKEIAELLVKNRLTGAEASTLITNAVELGVLEALETSVRANREVILKRIRELIASGAAGRLTNFNDVVKSSLQDMFVKSFDKSLRGYADALGTTLGNGAVDYIDNLVASQLNPIVSGIIADALIGAPDPTQLSGAWKGSVTVSKVNVSKSSQKQEGCDIDPNVLQGKSYPIELQISVGENGKGSVKGKAGGGAGSGSISYEDGTVTIVLSDKGSTMTMTGTASFVERGMQMGGGWTMSLTSGTDNMSGTWSLAKL